MTRISLLRLTTVQDRPLATVHGQTGPLDQLSALIKRITSHLNYTETCCGTPSFLLTALPELSDRFLAESFFQYFEVRLIKFSMSDKAVFFYQNP